MPQKIRLKFEAKQIIRLAELLNDLRDLIPIERHEEAATLVNGYTQFMNDEGFIVE